MGHRPSAIEHPGHPRFRYEEALVMVRCRRPAMACWFEAWLVGDDEEHLAAVGEAALDEVTRVERLLSRHDPAAEVARLNREAAARPVRVDRELFAILEDVVRRREQTDGYFDALAPQGPGGGDALRLDREARTVRFLTPGVSLDLGGYGKGYALDAAARVLGAFGVATALLHGGTSSVLARGAPEGATAWRVGLRDPFADDERSEVTQVDLLDITLSSSATGTVGPSDVRDPVAGRALRPGAACSVLATTATEAEVLSTALLAMGRRRAGRFLEREGWPSSCRAAWIARRGGRVTVEWLGTGGQG